MRRSFALVGGAAIVVALAGCAGGGGSAGPTTASTGDSGDVDWSGVEAVELTVSNPFPPGSTAVTLVESWMDSVTEATEGKVTFDYYPNSTLHPLLEGLSALQSGLTDLTYINGNQFSDQLPIAGWDATVQQHALADFGYPNMNIAGIGQYEVHYMDEENVARAEMESQGFFPLLPMLSGPAALTCSQPFETPDDLEGRQVRITDAVAQGENEALGMTGVFLAPTEQYEALQRGVLDCAVNAPTTILSAGLLDVTPWVALTANAPTTSAYWVFSEETWASLAPEVQDAMLEARYGPITDFAKNTLDSYAELPAAAEEAGGGVVDAAPFNDAIAQWWADQPDPVESAPDGVDDPQASVDRTFAIAEAWWDFSVNELGVPVDNDDILEVLEQGSGVIDDWDAWTSAVTERYGLP